MVCMTGRGGNSKAGKTAGKKAGKKSGRKGRSKSTERWLSRQRKDPFAKKAVEKGADGLIAVAWGGQAGTPGGFLPSLW